MNKILVIGFGISGRSSAAFLLKRGDSVIAVDKKAQELKSDPQLASFFSQGLQLFSETAELSLEGFDLAIVSPGIPPNHPIVERAAKQGIELVGEIEFAFRHIRNRCIGITGTNGKTTTVLLITHILNSAGKKARAVGNVGASLTGYLMSPDPEEILVVELSSFQLETIQSRCLEAAAILNMSPNHLDWHPSMEAYVKAKLRIQECLKENGKLFVSQQVQKEFGSLIQVQNVQIFDADPKPARWETIASISPESYIQLGVPERQNVRAAFSFCAHFGVSEEEFRRGLETFRKPAHRIEWVADIADISYYNDSKSSNIDSVMHAVELMQGPIVLLAGGVDKGSSYTPWIKAFKGKVKKIIAYGLAAAKMEKELSKAYSFSRVQTLQEALMAAQAEAKAKDTVLLSPGCSSYDQFRNYEHRGEEFKRLVKERERG